MSEEHTPYSEEYRRVREAFDGLQLESQARFLIEATAATIGRGIDILADRVAKDMSEAFQEKAEPGEASGAAEEPDSPSSESDDDAVSEEP